MAQKLNAQQIEALYPIGTVYINATDPTNPADLLGFGTWVAWGVGKAIVGIDTNDTDFGTAEKTGGSKTHTLTVNEMPSHSHPVNVGWYASNASRSRYTNGSGRVAPSSDNVNDWSWVSSTSSVGGGQAHNNLQPYQVGYVWKRTA